MGNNVMHLQYSTTVRLLHLVEKNRLGNWRYYSWGNVSVTFLAQVEASWVRLPGQMRGSHGVRPSETWASGMWQWLTTVATGRQASEDKQWTEVSWGNERDRRKSQEYLPRRRTRSASWFTDELREVVGSEEVVILSSRSSTRGPPTTATIIKYWRLWKYLAARIC